LIPKTWLLWAAVAIVGAQVAIVLLLVARNAWVESRLNRLRSRSRLLARMYDELGAGGSAAVRAELGRRTLLADLRTLEHWLDIVVRRGRDPAGLSAEDYEFAGLVARHLRALRTERRWIRRATAAEILGWTGSSSAVPALIETALDASGEPPPVRNAALRSLERIRHPGAVPPLIAALGSEETWFQPRAATVLARIGGPAVEPLVRELADASRPAVIRRWAAHVLGEIGDRRALRRLHEALADVDPELRARAAKALGRLRDASSVGPLLDRLLTDPSAFVRTSVARALGQLPTRETVEFLTRSLSDPEWWVRLRAVESLANLGSPARDALRGALHDRDPLVSREAARGLERMGAVADALEMLREEGYTPEVTELLHDVGKAGNLEALLEGLHDGHAPVVNQVIRILGRIGDRRAGPALVELLGRTDDASLQARILEALRSVGAKGFDREIARYLAVPDEWVRRAALGYLEAFTDPRRPPDVAPLLADADPGVRRAALRLVERVRPAAFPAEALLASLSDPDRDVRASGARALASLGRHDLLLARGVAAQDDLFVATLLRGLGRGTDRAAIELALALFPRTSDRDLERLAALVVDVARSDPAETARHLADRDDAAGRWALASAALVLAAAGLPVDVDDLVADEDPRVRAAALPAAMVVGADDASGPGGARRASLVGARTTDRAPLVASAAVRALAAVPGAEAERRIVAALGSVERRVAVDVALALGLRRALRGNARECLERLAEHDEVRLATVAARIHQGEADALPEWLAAVRDERDVAIVRAWREEGHPLFAVLLSHAATPGAALATRLLAADSAYVAETALLHELEGCPEADVRLACVRGLRVLESRRAEGVLLGVCLMDPAPAVRSAALEFLVTRSRLPQKVGVLEHALRDPDEAVCIHAARKSEELQPEEAIPLLLRHLETRRAKFLAAVTEALARRADRQLEAIVRAIQTRPESEPALRALATILGRTRAPVPPDLASTLLRHRWAPVRAHALARLAPRLGPAAAGRILEAMGDPSPLVRLAAVRLCADPRTELDEHERERRPALARAREDPSARVRVRAARALKEIERLAPPARERRR
jgi:HEAT repeat protein